MTTTAAELYARAIADSNGGRIAAARRGLTLAGRRADDADLAARIAGTLAYLTAETGDASAALEAGRAAVAHPGISAHTRAVLTGQVGLIEMRRGDARAALAHLGVAIESLQDDVPRLGQLALNRGDAHLQLGDLTAAEADFAAATAAFHACGQSLDEAKARHNLGYTALLAGDLVTAIRSMDAARPELAAVSPVLAATCDADRAEALLAAGMPSEASDLLESAARSYGAQRLRQAQAEAELLLARTLSYSEPGVAAAIARRAARRFRARGSTSWALRADGWALTACVLAGRRVAVADLDATAAALARRGMAEDARRLRLHAARLVLRAGRGATARARLRRALPTASAPIAERLLAREIRAELARGSGRMRAALTEAARGLDDLGRMQAELGSVDLQTSLVLHGRPILALAAECALEAGDPATVFEWAERARNLVDQQAAVTPAADPAVAADLAEVRRLRAFGGGDADRDREQALADRLRERSWHVRGSGLVPVVPALDRVAEAAGAAGATAVDYLWSGGRLAAVVVGGQGTRVVQLGECEPVRARMRGLAADLESAASGIPGRMGDAVRAVLADRLARLDALLIAPLALPDGPVVLSVPGALAGLPWPMLPGLAGRPITVPTSLTAWVGAPDRAAPRSAGFAAGPGVARGEEEVLLAAGAWPGASTLTGAAATAAAVAELAPRVDVLHLAGHGRHQAEHPLFSGVELVGGPWFGHDVRALPRVPGLVVLSACEVGRSAVLWGQESTGMARAWLHAGTRCVIASPASVDDGLACDVLADLHHHLAAGASPAMALAASSRGRPNPFQCLGDGL